MQKIQIKLYSFKNIQVIFYIYIEIKIKIKANFQAI
jgi:hypothetical protein